MYVKLQAQDRCPIHLSSSSLEKQWNKWKREKMGAWIGNAFIGCSAHYGSVEEWLGANSQCRTSFFAWRCSSFPAVPLDVPKPATLLGVRQGIRTSGSSSLIFRTLRTLPTQPPRVGGWYLCTSVCVFASLHMGMSLWDGVHHQGYHLTLYSQTDLDWSSCLDTLMCDLEEVT